MGGGSNSSPPVDVAPGGGTYPVNAFGEAYNPAWNSSGWTGAGQGISRGFQQYGAGLSQQPTISANGSISQPFTLPTQQQSAAIPIEGQGAEQQIQEILKILQSILGSQGGT